jgi:hypothetical protein
VPPGSREETLLELGERRSEDRLEGQGCETERVLTPDQRVESAPKLAARASAFCGNPPIKVNYSTGRRFPRFLVLSFCLTVTVHDANILRIAQTSRRSVSPR